MEYGVRSTRVEQTTREMAPASTARCQHEQTTRSTVAESRPEGSTPSSRSILTGAPKGPKYRIVHDAPKPRLAR